MNPHDPDPKRAVVRYVGGFQLRPAPDDYRLLVSMFQRLPKEVTFAGLHAGLVGYECVDGEDTLFRFLGVEVEEIGAIPPGMVAWEFDGDRWTVWQPAPDGRGILWREEIRWQWREVSRRGRALGEFTARGADDWLEGDARPFTLFAWVYVDPAAGGFRDEVSLESPDPDWPSQYEQMAGWLRKHLGEDVLLKMEHYGSTAIPGMPAKPVIDILAWIPSFEEGRKRILPALDEETWEYWWYGGHMVFFKRKGVMEERTHHLHLAPAGHEIWQGIAFRDHLRTHPGDAARYAELKHRLAEAHRHDREKYTQAKGDFVKGITRKALGSQESPWTSNSPRTPSRSSRGPSSAT